MPFKGSLFTDDFLRVSIRKMWDYSALQEGDFANFRNSLQNILERFPYDQRPNESQTEEDLIWPILRQLGWTDYLRQQNLSSRGRVDIPDGLLFTDGSAKKRANKFSKEWRRYSLGLVIVESKRWRRPLDRRSVHSGEVSVPSTQMLRFLRRVDTVTEGKIRWGVLTNGERWRLFFQGARSVSEQFFEISLADLFNLPSIDTEVKDITDEQRIHWLRIFFLVFRREAFLPDATSNTTFHERAIADGHFYEESVASNLSEVVFDQVFPRLTVAILKASPDSGLDDVRQATLVFLYRLLFILYAEDRDLLPIRDSKYDDYGLRNKIREDIRRRKDQNDVFSSQAARYWSSIRDLCLAINQGDSSIGLPPYNGGLFDPERTPLLETIRLSDDVIAEIVDALSFQQTPEGRRYINYRDLGVRQLGSIYERLLEYELIHEGSNIIIRLNKYARKGTGSYYTPVHLIELILHETVGPIVKSLMENFESKLTELTSRHLSSESRAAILSQFDPAQQITLLKICDPATGSGHFLVNLVDYLSDHVLIAMAEAEARVEGYTSPLTAQIDAIRRRIMQCATDNGWTINFEQLDDRHIVRRMVLKRCIYGVDKNPMAVELAKVGLWLHTFTVGAPLSFLDHHVRCGDSLFGLWVRTGIVEAEKYGTPLFLRNTLDRAARAAMPMHLLEGLTDAEIAEAHRSAGIFDEIQEMTTPLNAFLTITLALKWLRRSKIYADDQKANSAAVGAYFAGTFGDQIDIAMGKLQPNTSNEQGRRFSALLDMARQIASEERFLHWQVAFPGVWTNWKNEELNGGFDAVVGNPPWEDIKVEPLTWFKERRPDIAKMQHAADRHKRIDELKTAEDPMITEFENAYERAGIMTRMAVQSGDYPRLSRQEINLYSLFVERALALVKKGGFVGLVIPSGIATNKTAAQFFQHISTQGRLKAFYDFENKKVFFRDVHSSLKFCAFVAASSSQDEPAKCAFYLHSVSEISNPDRLFRLTADDFARINPNTGTVPIFRFRRDAEITTAVYRRIPILNDKSKSGVTKTWPVKYKCMFHMSRDSVSFRTREQLVEQEGAYHVGGNEYESPAGRWIPLYEGKMVQTFDHRAASVKINPDNPRRPRQPLYTTLQQHQSWDWLPSPAFWVPERESVRRGLAQWQIAFKDVTKSSNVRTMIAALIPRVAAGHTLPLFLFPDPVPASDAALLIANLNALAFDYVCRQKVHSTHLLLYILEQLPFLPRSEYEDKYFGPRSASSLICDLVLELTYTASDMAAFAHDVGYVDDAGNVKPPFCWNEDRRLYLRAKLDAIYFYLYGITERDDIRYIYSTFPIVERKEQKLYECYRSRDLCLAWMNALSAGDPDAEVTI